jgi:hypothetical protein
MFSSQSGFRFHDAQETSISDEMRSNIFIKSKEKDIHATDLGGKCRKGMRCELEPQTDVSDFYDLGR